MDNDSMKSTQGPAATLRHDAEAVVEEAKSGLQQVSEELRKDADEVVSAAKEQASSLVHEVEGAINARKGGVADTLEGVASAMRRAADELGKQQNGSGADMTRQLAARVAGLSQTLKSNDVGALIGQAENFGRQQPAAFLGASALLGFAASRFLVASSHRSRGTQDAASRAQQSGGYGSGASSFGATEHPVPMPATERSAGTIQTNGGINE